MHRIGGLVYYDGANLNAILGRCRPGDMGFDIVHINTHKTFATPHGGGGPGAGPVGVTEELVPFLPAAEHRTRRDRRVPLDSDARIPSGACTASSATSACSCARTPTCCRTARDGMRGVAERAVLNANYLAALGARTFPLDIPVRPAHARVRASARPSSSATGIRAMDVAKALLDRGFHSPTVYFPLVVEEALMVEPTETETRETLDVSRPR